MPTVSVVIPIFSEGEEEEESHVIDFLGNLIDSTLEKGQSLEIIPIINGLGIDEDNKLYKLCEDIGIEALVIDQDEVEETKPRRAERLKYIFAARNLGFEVAESNRVIGLDLDCRVDESWIRNVIEALESSVLVECPIDYDQYNINGQPLLQTTIATFRGISQLYRGNTFQGGAHAIHKKRFKKLFGENLPYNLIHRNENEIPAIVKKKVEERKDQLEEGIEIVTEVSGVTTVEGYKSWRDWFRYAVVRHLLKKAGQIINKL